MKGKRLSVLIGSVCLILVLAALPFMGACAAPAPAPTPAPAPEEEVIHWKASTCWTPAINLIEADYHMVEIIEKMSNGRLKIDFYPAGAIVAVTELFDAVKDGALDAASDYPGYWTGKERALDFYFSFAEGMTPEDLQIWLYHAGGLELLQEIYGKYGLYYLPVGLAGMESGLRSNKPLRTLDDYKGLKIRMGTRVASVVLEQIGAKPTSMAGGELYTALDRGTLDAAEFSMPTCDWGMSFQEVTKYWCLPGWHQPNWGGGWTFNMDSWNALPDYLKEIVKVAARETGAWSWAKWEYESIDATRKFLDAGIIITYLDQESLDKLQELCIKYVEDEAAKDPMFKRVAKSYFGFLKEYEQWREMEQSGDYGFGRNLKIYPKLD